VASHSMSERSGPSEPQGEYTRPAEDQQVAPVNAAPGPIGRNPKEQSQCRSGDRRVEGSLG